MVETPASPIVRDPGAVAAYVETLTGELTRLAKEAGLPTLAYILDMARLEARNVLVLERAASGNAPQNTEG